MGILTLLPNIQDVSQLGHFATIKNYAIGREK